jgi:hypothetical protein
MSYRSTFFVLLALTACDGAVTAPDAAVSPDAAVAENVTLQALDAVHVSFTGTENHRTVDTAVSFPAAGQRYSSVVLHVTLACPTGGCDAWDRLAHLSLVDPGPTASTDDDVELEIARFITPYGVGYEMDVDVTDLQRVLEGDRTLRVFVDTWVGPGSPYGAGWLVSARFDFVGGTPSPDPFAVVPLWAPSSVVYGDPARPTARTVDVTIPEGASSARLRALVTGHGQGNADNCAEFCSRDHTFDVGGASVTSTIWRTDCATTAAPGQMGTFQYPRAGWCPGALVAPWTETIAAPAAGALTVRYDVQSYENTCRPDATTCAGCSLGTGCAYDDGAHTEPRFEQSAVLILYR